MPESPDLILRTILTVLLLFGGVPMFVASIKRRIDVRRSGKNGYRKALARAHTQENALALIGQIILSVQLLNYYLWMDHALANVLLTLLSISMFLWQLSFFAARRHVAELMDVEDRMTDGTPKTQHSVIDKDLWHEFEKFKIEHGIER